MLSTTQYLALGGLALGVLVWQMDDGDLPEVSPPGTGNKNDGSAQTRSSDESSDSSTVESGYSKADVQDLMSIQESGPEGFQAGTRATLVTEQQSDYYVGRGSTGL